MNRSSDVKRIITILLASIVIIGNAYSNNNDIQETLGNMFKKVDFKSIPTGLLRDYAVEEEDLDLFTGSSTLIPANCTTGIQFAGLINTVNSLSHSRNILKGIENSITSYNSNPNEIPICVLLYKYSQIKADALEKSLISYNHGQVTINQSTESPFQQEYVFATCGLKRNLKNSSVTFSFPSQLKFTNCNIRDFQIDYGDGIKSISHGDNIKATLKPGNNDIRIYVILTNGDRLSSHTNIFIETENNILSRSSILPVLPIQYTEPDDSVKIIGDAYKGITTSATVFIRYGSKNGVKHSNITKPFIFVEGFDPICLSSSQHGGWNDSTLYVNYNPYIQQLLSSGFDVIYVDWDKSEEYIQANANVLINVLNHINNKKHTGGSNEKNILLGYSMGGLIGRYALKKMENNGCKHEVISYISYDSPHLGAHIPLGILYGFHGIKKFIQDYGLLTKLVELFADIDIPNLIELGEKIAYSTAAQQMLVYYVDPLGNFNNNEHKLWQQELNNLGFPKGDAGSSINMLAIAHGSYKSVVCPEHYLYTSFKAQSDVLNLSALGPLAIGVCLNNVVAGLLTCLPGRTTIQGEVGLYPAHKYNDRITHLSLKYKKKFLWLIPINKDLFTYDRSFPNCPTYDLFPSSIYGISNNSTPINSNGQPGGVKVLFWWDFDCDPAQSIPFIPTSSALAVGNGLNIKNNDYLINPTTGASAFGENIYILDSPTPHTSLHPNALKRIISSISTVLEGPTVGVSGSQYSLSNNSYPITWSTSDPSIASIDSKGQLTVKGKGIISIIAKANTYTYSKNIMVGMPRFILSGNQTPGGYKVEARCIDSEYSNKLNLLNGAIKYHWGIKYPERDILWYDYDESEIIIPVEAARKNVSVFFQITDLYDSKSTIQSITCNINDIYYANNDLFYIDVEGQLYKANKSKTSYDVASIYLNYLDNIDESFEGRDWMVTSAKVGGTISSPHIAPISRNRILVRDIVTEDELSYMKTVSQDNDSYSYFLILRNSSKESIQLLPITFTFKTHL